jgi:hypothetical protein
MTKRKARAKFSKSQRHNLHKFARNDPQKFWKEIKKIRNKNKNMKSKLSKDEFYEYFKNLFSNDEIFENNYIEEQLNNGTNTFINIDELDCDFSYEEVDKAFSTLKRGKSAGSDKLVPDIFIDCKDLLIPVFIKLFNYIYSRGVYPSCWCYGVIVPVPKKGNADDINNYRGITLTSVFSKLFSILLDIRLRKWAESNNLITDYQYGFRKDKGTVDCIFVLTSIIDKILNTEKKKVYAAFVDFRKCFDMLYRNGIWFKLIQTGVSTKMVRMLKSLYENVKCCVKVNGALTENFETYMGVKQGEPLSPLLFILFVNDMYQCLQSPEVPAFTLNEIQSTI